MSIFASRVAAPVIGYGSSRILLDNCSITRPLAGQVLAADDSTIVSLDSTLGGNLSYAARDLGRVDLEWTVSVRVTDGIAPASGARVAAVWTNGTVAASATTPANGTVQLFPVARVLTAAGIQWSDLFELWAAWQWDGALDPKVNVSAPTSIALALGPLVLAVNPASAIPMGSPTRSTSRSTLPSR